MNGVSEVVVNEEAVNGNAEPLHIYQDLKRSQPNHIKKKMISKILIYLSGGMVKLLN